MRNLIFGLAVGVITGYALRKMEEQGQFDCLCEKANEWADKTTQKIKGVVDAHTKKAENTEVQIEPTVELE